MVQNEPRITRLTVLDPRQPGWSQAVIAAAADTMVQVLDSRRDGLSQVLELASELAPLEIIDLPEHGGAGRVVLGTSILDAQSLTGLEERLEELGRCLTPDGTLRIGGSNAGGSVGARLMAMLARALGRDVRAPGARRARPGMPIAWAGPGLPGSSRALLH